MKKSNFVAMMLGTVSGVLFALGMCMVLLPQWDSFLPGVIFGGIGFALGLVTVIVWRRMENKAPVKITGKTVAVIAVSIVGALGLGVGMCFCMVWESMVLGVLIGVAGILALLSLIPLVRGLN